MINTALLKHLIVERGTTQEVIADEIGINRSTFYRKMQKGGSSFTIAEAKLIAQTVPLTNHEAISIFFGETVA